MQKFPARLCDILASWSAEWFCSLPIWVKTTRQSLHIKDRASSTMSLKGCEFSQPLDIRLMAVKQSENTLIFLYPLAQHICNPWMIPISSATAEGTTVNLLQKPQIQTPRWSRRTPPHLASCCSQAHSPPEIHEIASAEANSIQMVAFEPTGSA